MKAVVKHEAERGIQVREDWGRRRVRAWPPHGARPWRMPTSTVGALSPGLVTG